MKNRYIFKEDKNLFSMKFLFHIANLLLILLYLYPGSIFGYIVFGNSSIQPQLTKDLFNISSNHIYVFTIISLLGLIAYNENKLLKKILFYLFFLAIFLEFMHLAIPQRGFEIKDLAGNILGVIVSFFIFLVIKIWRKL